MLLNSWTDKGQSDSSLAYTYVTRHLSVSPLASTTNDPQYQYEARKILLQSVPFLRDRKSKLLHLSLADAVISFWSQFDPVSWRPCQILLDFVDAE